MILVSQSYTASTDARNAELQKCQKHNEDLGLFDRVEYLETNDRILSFSELHDHCVSKYRGKWCVISNSDITFNATAYMLKSLCRIGRLVALTRWESHHGPNMLGHVHADRMFAELGPGRLFSGTQDSWAFLAGSLPELPADELTLGKVGCDQVIAGWGVASKLEVINPALSIKTTHVHSDVGRNYVRPVATGFYGYPQLTTMHTSGDVLCHEFPDQGAEWLIYRYTT